MKKNRIAAAMVILFCSALMMVFPGQAEAKVKKADKKAIGMVLNTFDEYLGYGCGKGTTFRFDDYARTSMLCMADWKFVGQSVAGARKIYKPVWKKYFTAPFNFKVVKNKGGSEKPSPDPWKNPSHLIQVMNGKMVFMGGDWGDRAPSGRIRSITQNTKTKYTAVYDLEWKSWEEGTTQGFMGRYKVVLKKSGKTFRISSIKRVKAKAVI